MKPIFIPLGILLIIVSICTAFFPKILHQQHYIMLVFLALIQIITVFITGFGLKNSPEKFAYYFFFSMFVRALSMIVYIFICLYNQTPNILLFIGNLFFGYFLCLAFEIYFLFNNLQTKIKTTSDK